MTPRSLAMIGAVAGVGVGVLGAVLITIQATEPPTDVFGWALGLVYLVPFVLAVLASRLRIAAYRSAVWIAVGAVGLFLSFTSPSGVTLVLLIPSALLVWGAIGDLRDAQPCSRILAWSLGVGVVIATVGAAASLLIFSVERCESFPGGSSCGSIVTPLGAALSLVAWVLAIAGLVFVARHPRREPSA